MFEYYTRPFLYFHKALTSHHKPTTIDVRKSFWRLIPERDYTYLDGKPLFQAYLNSLENRIKTIVEKYSIIYWLHLNRRILPASLGEDKQPQTIMILRGIINAAIQKYGQRQFCAHIGKSKEIKINQVFNGLLMSEEFELERAILVEAGNQIVFTDFTYLNLIEYYELEKLCYEVWFCEAKMRSLQKGAIVRVTLDDPQFIQEYRTEELGHLITNYDDRDSGFFGSATGTIFANKNIDRNSDLFIPILNVNHVKIDELNEVFNKLFNVIFGEDYTPNFLLMPIPLKKYLNVHLPFDKDFVAKHGISFQSVIFVITALCFRYFYQSLTTDRVIIIKIIQRGYEGPLLKTDITDVVMNYREYVKVILGLDFTYSRGQLINAINYLTSQNSSEVNLLHSGTLKMFIPVGEGRVYIDYSVIPQILNHLFFGIDLNGYNFRGETLENAFEGIKYFLPTKPLKNEVKQSKQIDFSTKINNILILGECKVVAMSLGYYTGDINALNHRTEKVIKAGLTQADDKARWLAANPKGRNYNLEGIDYILPIAISSFKEFIPSLDHFFWINDNMPRVLTILEVEKLISEKIRIDNAFNLIPVIR